MCPKGNTGSSPLPIRLPLRGDGLELGSPRTKIGLRTRPTRRGGSPARPTGSSTSQLAPDWDLSLAPHDLSVDVRQDFPAGYGLTLSEVPDMAQIGRAINFLNLRPFVERAPEDGRKLKLKRHPGAALGGPIRS